MLETVSWEDVLRVNLLVQEISIGIPTKALGSGQTLSRPDFEVKGLSCTRSACLNKTSKALLDRTLMPETVIDAPKIIRAAEYVIRVHCS
jgi:hypothetical protein